MLSSECVETLLEHFSAPCCNHVIHVYVHGVCVAEPPSPGNWFTASRIPSREREKYLRQVLPESHTYNGS